MGSAGVVFFVLGIALGWELRSLVAAIRRCKEIDRRMEAANKEFWKGEKPGWPYDGRKPPRPKP